MAREARVSDETLLLADFLPFRLNRLAEAVSARLSEIYRDRFDLEIADWRVLVTVGERGDCTARHIADSTRMHKTRVSRAVASLLARRWLAATVHTEDAREIRLRLSAAGRRVYAALVPLALERERELLACLAQPQRHAFLAALANFETSLALRDHE